MILEKFQTRKRIWKHLTLFLECNGLEKFNEKDDVCNAIGAHHDEVEMKSLLAPIIQVCDAISGARPGARRQVFR